MHPYITGLTKLFKQHANAEKAAGAKAYMRNQFEYLGLTAPLRQNISKTYIKAKLPEYKELEIIVKELWQLPEREYQYFAIDLIAAFKNQWTKRIIKLMEFVLVNKSWWDSVDAASNLTGPYFKSFPGQTDKITGKWNQSDNFWLQRSSILFQLNIKKIQIQTCWQNILWHVLHRKNSFFKKPLAGLYGNTVKQITNGFRNL